MFQKKKKKNLNIYSNQLKFLIIKINLKLTCFILQKLFFIKMKKFNELFNQVPAPLQNGFYSLQIVK